MVKMFHYYSVCFRDISGNFATAYIRRDKQYVSKAVINAVSKHLDLSYAALVAVSYLGYMTEKEFNGEEE